MVLKPKKLSFKSSNLGNANREILIELSVLGQMPVEHVNLSCNNFGTLIGRDHQEDNHIFSFLSSLLTNPQLRTLDLSGNDDFGRYAVHNIQFLREIYHTEINCLYMGGCQLSVTEQEMGTSILIDAFSDSIKKITRIDVSQNGLSFDFIKWMLTHTGHLNFLKIGGNQIQNSTINDWEQLISFVAFEEICWKQLDLGSDPQIFLEECEDDLLVANYIQFLYTLQERGIQLTIGGATPVHLLPSNNTLVNEYPDTIALTHVIKTCPPYVIDRNNPNKPMVVASSYWDYKEKFLDQENTLYKMPMDARTQDSRKFR
jgi:hypothetical protein